MVMMESSCARACTEMKRFDPEFDLYNLSYEFEEIFKEFYCNYLTGHLEYLDKICGKQALAVVKTEVKRRQTEGWKYKYEDILDCGHTMFTGGQVPDKSPP